MALVKGTNSYVTVAEADAYFADRLDVTAWTAADATLKAQALVTSTSLLDDRAWTGTALDELQPLAFPRTGFYFDPRLGVTVEFDGVTVPPQLLKAVKELANYLLNNSGVTITGGSVENIQVGSISLTNVKAAEAVPAMISNMIKMLTANGGSNSWWRAN
jgi:hypothetical protein